MSKLTQDQLKEFLHYNPDTGKFTWLVSRSKVKAGDIAGTVDGQGYINIGLMGVTHCAHRLAVLYMTGSWPEHDVDHEDLDKANNAWCNLRPATDTQNEANKPLRSDNTTGYKGVYRGDGKFVAQIKIGGVKKYLGRFTSAEEAHAAYLCAANAEFGEFARAA